MIPQSYNMRTSSFAVFYSDDSLWLPKRSLMVWYALFVNIFFFGYVIAPAPVH